MMNNNGVFLLVVIHSVICLIYFAVNLKFKGLQDSFYKFFIVFFLPAAGLLFFIVSAILSRIPKRSDSIVDNYLKYISEKEHIYYEEAIDFEKEINTVPMEDSLSFSDNKSKRAYLIYILKKDFASHIKGLQKAIRSRDSETSHYAASALVEIKKQFEILLTSAHEKYKNNRDDINAIQEYVNILKKYLKSGLTDKADYYNYLEKYSAVLTELLSRHLTNEIYFIDKINCDLELGDYKSAEDFSKRFFEYFPNSEKPYLALLKFYYLSRDVKSFTCVAKILKSKKIGLTDYGESVIKFWEGSKSDVY
jgi:tetratricopeptide (TPR) repeat protein